MALVVLMMIMDVVECQVDAQVTTLVGFGEEETDDAQKQAALAMVAPVVLMLALEMVGQLEVGQ